LTLLGGQQHHHLSVRGRRWRYTLCANGEEELYDHANDPHEWHNLANRKGHEAVKAELKDQLLVMIDDRTR
jgi:hypothetical protein